MKEILDGFKTGGTVSFSGTFTKDKPLIVPGSTVKLYLDDKNFIEAEVNTIIDLDDGSLDCTIKNVRMSE